MNNKKSIIIRSALCALMAIVLVALIVGNVICNKYFDTITEFFHGADLVYDSEELEKALANSSALCREIEEEGIVLFKNEDMNRGSSATEVSPALPMSEAELAKVNVFGWSSTEKGWVAGSDGSCNANNGANKNKIAGILKAFDKAEIGADKKPVEYNKELIAMYEDFRIGRAERRGLAGHDQFFMLIEPERSAYDKTGANGKTILENAKEFSDVAIVVISRLGGENNDLPYFQLKNTTGKYSDSDTLPRDDTRTYLDISTEEEDLLKMCRENFRKVIVVYNGCNNMNLEFLDRFDVDACISVNGTGQTGAFAIPDVLSGKVNPSGKSTQIQPYDLSTDPTFKNQGKYSRNTGAMSYLEDIYVGYKWYETADEEGYWKDKTLEVGNKKLSGYEAVVQYPFGFGLSYTSFEWTVLERSPAAGEEITENTEFSVTVAVTNVGKVAGMDVVELYYRPPYYEGGIEKSSVNLAAFAKTGMIEPGQTAKVTLKFNAYDMASYDCYDRNHNRNYGYELDGGDYEVVLMNDSHTKDDCEKASVTYRLTKNLKFRQDPVTGNVVSNRFTKYDVIRKNEAGEFVKETVNAYANCATDGSDSTQSKIDLLSRSDFAGTFPTETAKARTGSAVNEAKSFVPEVEKVTEKITTSVDKGLRLVTKEDGSYFSLSELNGGLKNAKVNDELVQKLGNPKTGYDAPEWETLLNEMSYDEIFKLVQDGNYYNVAVESIGKPKLLDSDGPSGLNRHVAGVGGSDKQNWTMYCMPVVIAQSWNTNLSYSFGLSVAAESLSSGNNGWYAPGANIQRSPFCGRNSEYYSEDSLLSGKMAAESCRGAIANGMNVYLKHFALNETESGRIGLFTWASEQAIRENYLRSFEIAVKEGGANGIMTALNRVGAVWAGANRAMTTEILRDEWGFKGSVVTDSYMGASYNPIKQSLYGGVTLMLGVGTGDTIDKSDLTLVAAARKAAKDIIYAWCNSYTISKNHDHSQDIIKTNVGTFVQGEKQTPYWCIGLIALDVVVVSGVGVATFFLFRKKKVKEAAISEK